jgi:hypothetical protein
MKTVYLAGPYTKPDPVVNTRDAILFGAQLRDTYGLRVFVPHMSHFEHLLEPKPYSHWLKVDLEWLPLCDVLYRMPGESSGADKEVEAAKAAGIPVVSSLGGLEDWLASQEVRVSDR